jgi:methionyl-tRNA formyltransferase
MRLIFIATGEIALPSFQYLLNHGPRPLALVTQPDKPVGRHQVLTPPAIKVAALAAGIPVYQPEKIGDITSELAVLEPELVVVMAYGQILRDSILNIASKAIINLHASLLPKYRGAACIQAAIDAGDSHTGITAMHVVRALDAGDIILMKALAIDVAETGGTLHDRLALLAPEVLAETIAQLESGTAVRVPQNPEESSYISKLERDAGKIEWSKSAAALARRIRAYDPWPGSYTHVREDGVVKRLKLFPPCVVLDQPLAVGETALIDGVLTVGCGEGAIQFEFLQPEGSRRMAAADYARGRKVNGFEIG